jgi:hypothetical protein
LFSGDLSGMLEESDQVLEAAQRMGDWLLVYLAYGFRSWAQGRMGKHEQAMQSMARAQAARSRVGGHLMDQDKFEQARAQFEASGLEGERETVERYLAH